MTAISQLRPHTVRVASELAQPPPLGLGESYPPSNSHLTPSYYPISTPPNFKQAETPSEQLLDAIFPDFCNSSRLPRPNPLVLSISLQGVRYGLLAAILCEDIEDDERHALDRILRSVGSGRLSFA